MSRKNLQWDHTLDLTDIWKKLDSDEINPCEASGEIAIRLRAHELAKEFEDVADDFEDLSFSDDLERDEMVKEFDYILSRLYDIADFDKQCWVKTRF